MMKSLGQYSIVSYVHELRGERVNLGVLVWHPSSGCAFRAPKNLSRVRVIDESADLEWVRAAIEHISETADTWSQGDKSPLESLAREFRRGLVVTEPLNARIQDPFSTLERLSTTLIAPEPYMRASSTRQFASVFARYLEKELKQRGVSTFQRNFVEDEAFQPIEVTALYRASSESVLWRAVSFAGQNDPTKQLTLAKAFDAENAVLKDLEKYSDAHLFVAAQMPKPQAQADWGKAIEWLGRTSENVEVFVDRQSLEAKVPELLPSTLSPTLT